MRLFFGLPLPPHIHQSVSDCAASCRARVPGRYVPEVNYHITLAFLGDVPPERVDAAASVLARCIRHQRPLLLTLGDTSFFGRVQNGILIVRIASTPPLEPLHAALTEALAGARLPFDGGPFSPHVTLARHACVQDAALPSCPPLSFTPAQAHLYLSARNEQGILSYTPIRSMPFCADRSCLR